jgi:hypothetical protein
MIPGPELVLGERTYTVPPLPFAGLKKHKAFLGRAARGELDAATMFEAEFENMFDVVYLALKRNYPDLTEQALEELVDQRNISEAFSKVMEAAGFRAKPAGE